MRTRTGRWLAITRRVPLIPNNLDSGATAVRTGNVDEIPDLLLRVRYSTRLSLRVRLVSDSLRCRTRAIGAVAVGLLPNKLLRPTLLNSADSQVMINGVPDLLCVS